VAEAAQGGYLRAAEVSSRVAQAALPMFGNFGKIPANFRSFSAVSAPIFASKNIPALRAKQGYTQRRAAPS